jgi:uncharacterized protein YutE (UPF0331/DUF86 family)
MKERILQKCGRIREYLSLIVSLEPDCMNKFPTDPIYRGAMLHYLYLLADSCISLAEMVIRLKDLRPPQSYHEAFDILAEAKILDTEFAYSFAKIAGFRNFLAHDYEIVDAQIICNDVLNYLDDVKEFLHQIESVQP